MKKIIVLVATFILSGCVSGMIDHYSGRFKSVFGPEASQLSIRQNIGSPDDIYVKGLTKIEPKYRLKYNNNAVYSYDVFNVVGKVHKPGDGAAQATVSALTLGIGELILIPTTIVGVMIDYAKFHTLVVFYDRKGNYSGHRLFDSNGDDEGTSGY